MRHTVDGILTWAMGKEEARGAARCCVAADGRGRCCHPGSGQKAGPTFRGFITGGGVRGREPSNWKLEITVPGRGDFLAGRLWR